MAVLLAAMFVLDPSAISSSAASGAADPRERSLHNVSLGLKVAPALTQHTGTKERDPDYKVESHWRTGFAGGFFVCFPVTSRFGVQQEIMYVQKGSSQKIGVKILEIPTVLDVTYDMDYIEIPVLLRLDWYERRSFGVYGMAGTALSLKVHDRYLLSGEVSDGSQTIPIRADADMFEVDTFDYSLVYGLGLEFSLWKRHVFLEHRFVIGWNTLSMPTYAYVPFGDESILIDNKPVPLKNQAHLLQMGITF